MATRVVADGGPLLLGEQIELDEDLLHRLVRPLGSREGGVRVVDVRLVVLVVVEPHCLLVDRRLERSVAVRERRDLESHSLAPFVLFRGRYPPSACQLVFEYEQIAPRALKPALLELDGISRAAVEAHYKLYEGYVAKRNEILGRLSSVDADSANQVYSDLRALKVDLAFALGGIKNHEVYFDHLGGSGGDPPARSAICSSATSAPSRRGAPT